MPRTTDPTAGIARPVSGRVVNIQADSRYIDPETGKLELQKARPIVYSHGEYFALGRMLATSAGRSAAKRESNGSDNPTK